MPRATASTSSNLNECVQHEPHHELHFVRRVTTIFDGCEEAVVQAIESASSVVACVAWLTNAKLLRAMRRTPSRAVITSDPVHRRMATKLRQLREVRIVGTARGRFRPLMHCKFLVGFDATQTPQFVIMGSFNFTLHSTRNLEAMVRIDDEGVATAFYEEWKHIREISRPL